MNDPEIIKWLESDESYVWHFRRDFHTKFGHLLGSQRFSSDLERCNAQQDFDITGIPVTECEHVGRSHE